MRAGRVRGARHSGVPARAGRAGPALHDLPPKGDEPGLFAAGRYLLLSRVSAPGAGRGAAWHGINDALAALARNNGGAAVYVHRVPGEAAPRWDF